MALHRPHHHRTLIGQDLYSTALADAFTEHAHLFVFYGLGVLGIALLFQDSQVFARARRALARQQFKPGWLALFIATLSAQVGLKLSYGFLLAGSTNEAFRAQLPYSVTSALSILSTLIFGLFCYLALLSSRVRFLTAVCLAYVPYVLATDGRRAMVAALVTLFVLRQFSLGLRPNRRFAGIAAAALALFVLVGPIFVEGRSIARSLPQRGVSQTTALVQAPLQALDSLVSGKTTFTGVAATSRSAERGDVLPRGRLA